MPDEPIIDLQSDHYFMGEALRQARRAYEAEEVPVGAVVVRAGRIIARAFNQVEMLKDATAHAACASPSATYCSKVFLPNGARTRSQKAELKRRDWRSNVPPDFPQQPRL